jgi:N-acetylglucosamine kinase-like BadF-type ATPase
MRVFVGVDGGGTRARAVLVDEHGHVLRRAEGPAGLVDARTPERSADVIAALVRELAPDSTPAGLCCGLAGAGRAAEREAVAARLGAARLAEVVHVVTDAEAAMEDAFAETPGALVIAGTGSIAWARDAGGATHRVGGWGHLLDDEGSGYAIGLAGLRAVVRSADGRMPPTRLTELLLHATGCTADTELVGWTAVAAKADVAALAPHVLACASQDAAAGAIRAAAVAALHELTRTAVRRAGLDAPIIALAGGLLAESGPLRAELAQTLTAGIAGCRIHAGIVDAARGASALARRGRP